MPITFGIDFGTSNSALSVSRENSTEIVDLGKDPSSMKTMKSVLFFDEDGRSFVGCDAIKAYSMAMGAGRMMQSLKSFLPSKLFTETAVYDAQFKIEDLVAIILKEMKYRGEQHIGTDVQHVLLGRPVVFSLNSEDDALAERRLRLAAEKAGFKYIDFEYEPVAATIAYRVTVPEKQEHLVLMGDFGAGTSDFTIMRMSGGASVKGMNERHNILALTGVNVGGDVFDSRIMWAKVAEYFGKEVKYRFMQGEWLTMPSWIIATLCQWHTITQLRNRKTAELIRQIETNADDAYAVQRLMKLISEEKGFDLFQAIEKGKINLSSMDHTPVIFRAGIIQLDKDMTRVEFDDMTAADLKQIDLCITEALLKAQVRPNVINTVLLTGGSSFIPRVRRLFSSRFGEEKIKHIDAFTSVAYGLGLCALSY